LLEDPIVSALDLTDVAPRCIAVVDGLIPAAKSIVLEVDPTNAALLKVAENLVLLRSGVRAWTHLRPMVSLRTSTLLAVSRIEQCVVRLLEAFEVRTPLEAQRFDGDLQVALDAAGDEARKLGQLFDRYQRLAEGASLDEILGFVAEDTQLYIEGTGFLDVASYGSEVVAKHLPGFSCRPQSGLFVAIVSSVVHWQLNESEFWSATSEMVDWSLPKRAQVEWCLNQDSWQGDWSIACAGALGAIRRFELLSQMDANPLDRFHNWLSFSHEIQEGFAKFAMATLQSFDNVKVSRATLEAGGVHNLAEWCRARLFRSGEAFVIPSRQAFAHRDFGLTTEGVMLQCKRPGPNGPVILTETELINHVLHLLEACLAMMSVIHLLANKFSVDLAEPADNGSFSWQSVLTGTLSLDGCRNVSIELTTHELSISIVKSVPLSFSTLAGCLQFIPGHFEQAQFVVNTADGNGPCRIVAVPTVAYRRFESVQGVDKELEFLALLTESTIDGVPMLSNGSARQLAATYAMQIAADHRTVAMNTISGRIRRLREFAEPIDPGLAKELGKLLTFISYRSSGMESASLDTSKLELWATEKHPAMELFV
jgi:hypothetical protein